MKIKIKLQLIIIFKHISSTISLAAFYSFESEEKTVALLVYSSFRRVATTGIRNISETTRGVF